MMYSIVFILLSISVLLYFFNTSPLDQFFRYFIFIFCAMVIGVYLYPTAQISIFDDHLEFRKGLQHISVPWKEVLGLHKDPVFSPSPLSFYLAHKYPIGGFFLETSKGYTKYFAPQLIKSSDPKLTWENLVKDIQEKCGVPLQVGKVSLFKQRSKLYDIILILSLIFIVPVLIITAFGIMTGTFSDSLKMIVDLVKLFIGK